MEQDIEKMVKECRRCQLAAKAPPIKKIQQWPKMDVPWTRLYINNADLLKGHYYFMTVDSFSK